MAERITMSLYNAQQAHQAIQTAWRHAKGWLMASDTRLTLEIRPEKRSDAQNRLLHACLSEISKQVEWAGAFVSGCIGIGLYLFCLLFFWFAFDGLERQ